MAKATSWPNTDAEVRKRGEQTGLDTLVVHAVNDGSRLRHWCSFRYLRISPLHRKFHFPLPYSSRAVIRRVQALIGITGRKARVGGFVSRM